MEDDIVSKLYPVRKRTRLMPELYARPGAICSLTIAVKGRVPVFADRPIAQDTLEVLRSLAASTGVPVYGYCIMPDHVHLVIGLSPTCDIIGFVAQFKFQALRAAWQGGVKGSFWQQGFWDHFLRSDEGVERVVQYVLNNPVRKGLAATWRDYGFAGSLVLELS